MKKLIVFWMVLLCLLLTGCPAAPVKDNVFSSGRGDLYVPLVYSMPLGDPDETQKIGFSILEQDSYGRTLCQFHFDQYWNPFFQYGTAFCVIQGSTETTTSFYEDVCCAGTVDAADTGTVIAQLKETNDWNMPLEPEKMTTLPYEQFKPTGSFAIQKDYSNDKDTVLRTLNPDSQNGFLDWSCLNYLCRDNYGRTVVALFWFSGSNQKCVYLVMMKDNHVLQGDAATHLIENLSSPWKEIHAFKQANHWNEPTN